MVKDDTQTMLRAMINGQSAFRQEVLKRFKEIDNRFNSLETGLNKRINALEKNLTEKIDNIGRQLAYLEDDAPTREEFSKLEKRVCKLEQKPSPSV